MLYKIQNIDSYVNLIFYLVEGGSYDSMELEEPFFEGIDDVFDFFNIDDSEIDKIYNSNIEPIWDTSQELLPTKWLANILEKNKLKYPFYIFTDKYFCENNEQRVFKMIQDMKEI